GGRAGVVVLPTHPNGEPAARGAAGVADVRAFVADARSVPAGLAAAAAYLPSADTETNASAMSKAASGVAAGEVAQAVASVETEVGFVLMGQWIAARGDAVLEIGGDPAPVARALLERLLADVSDPEVVTVVLGGGARMEAPNADPVVAALRAAHPRLTVEAVAGGQPRHRYLIGVE